MHEVSAAVGGAEPGMVWAQGLNLQAINAETDRRGYVPVSEKMEVLDKSGKPVTNVFCIGDANGELTTLVKQGLTNIDAGLCVCVCVCVCVCAVLRQTQLLSRSTNRGSTMHTLQ